MKKYKGYINYFLEGVLKTYHIINKTREEVNKLECQFKSKPYVYAGSKITEYEDV